MSNRHDYAGIGRIFLVSTGVAFAVGVASGFGISRIMETDHAKAEARGGLPVEIRSVSVDEVDAAHPRIEIAYRPNHDPARSILSGKADEKASISIASSDGKPADIPALPIATDTLNRATASAGQGAVGSRSQDNVAENYPTELAMALPEQVDGAAATTRDSELAPVETMTPDEIKVRRGDTLFNILSDAGLDRLQAHDAVEALSAHYDPRKLKVGQVLSVATTTGGENRLLHRLELPIDDENDLALVRDPAGGFEVRTSTKQFVSERRRASGDIAISLYLAAQNAGVPQDTLMELIRLYSWDIDFQRDIHPNDRFEIYYDHMTSEDGSVVKSGGIIYAELTSGGEPLRAYRYENSDGELGYYDAQGRSLRKWLMRTPVDGARLSSGFGKRKHPILGYTRMHKGVDFAAPRGTPIYAAGDGTIAVIGRNGGYGNYVRIRHSGTYATAYAHMNGFAKGLGKGSRVKQGQVIGYVGSTGRSTGPHLHYEILKDGAQINPLSLKQDVAERLEGAEMARFAELRDRIDRELENPGSKTIVAQRP